MKESKAEPVTSPILRMGIAVIFLCCAALAIAYAWVEYERGEVQRLKSEASSTNVSSPDAASPQKSSEALP